MDTINLDIILPILIGLFISYMIISIILGNNLLISSFIKLYNHVQAKRFIFELRRLDYFKFSSFDNKQNLIEKIRDFFTNGASIPNYKDRIKELLSDFNFADDCRRFLIEINIDKEVLHLDKNGYLDKWEGLKLGIYNNNFEFLDFVEKIGLKITIKSVIFEDEEPYLITLKL